MAKLSKLALVNQDVDTSFFTIERTWQGLRSPEIKKQVGVAVQSSVAQIVQGKTINTYMEEWELKKFIHASAQVLLNDPAQVQKYKTHTIAVTRKLRELSIANRGRAKLLTDKQLSQLLLKFGRLQITSLVHGTVVAFADIYGEIGDAVSKIVNKRKRLSQPFSTYTSVLGQPEELSLTEQAYERIVSGKEPSKKLLEELFWLEQGYIGRGLTMSQLKAIRKHHKKNKPADRAALERELKLTKSEQQTFQTVRDIITIKSLRADSRQFVYVVLNEIIDKLAKKWKVKPEYLETLSIPEVRAILEKKLKLPDNLSQRWYHSVMIPKKTGGYKTLLGGQAKSYLEQNLLKETIDGNEVKGQIAYAGKVKGRARLVFGPQHNGKVKKGDILVSTSTSPQLLPAMKVAAAFVTDVGGITSHAAIVAREMKKPCVVGTKYATQILKDNDIIEVDANKGIVKKL